MTHPGVGGVDSPAMAGQAPGRNGSWKEGKDGEVSIKHLRTHTAAVPLQGGGLVVGRVTVDWGMTGMKQTEA